MATWRVAKSLDVLLDQWNTAHPDRSKASDGSIGDAAHQTRDSDHNPWVGPASDGKMIVTARDFTHDPEHGADADQLCADLVASRDPRIKYLIRNRRMCRSYSKVVDGRTYAPWEWSPYYGDSPHTKHAHLSVQSTQALYDSTRPWALGTPKEEISMADAASIERAIADLRKDIYAGPRYSALQNSITAANKGIAAILANMKTEDAADDAALAKVKAELEAAIEAAHPEPAP
jgi:hypothetical protein